MGIDCLIRKNCLLLVSIEVEELSAHCPVYKELTLKAVLGLTLDNNNRPYAIDVITSRN